MLAASLLLFSCERTLEDKKEDFIFEKSKLLKECKIPLKDTELLKKIGFSGRYSKMIEKNDYISNSTYIVYRMDGDIEIRQDLLKSMVVQTVENGRIQQF